MSNACSLVFCLFFTGAALAQDVKVAFIGDQGTSDSSRRVLELIRDEGTELLLIQGDLGYEDNSAQLWIDNIDSVLGDDFPVLMVVGNHENFEWDIYHQWQKDRLEKVSEIQCEGDISVKAYCNYKDIGVVQVSPGIVEVEGINGDDNYAEYITEKLQSDNSNWRICSWHKNMRDMQVGGKTDETGWGVYQSCLAQGGIVINGHEHSYSRTHLMSDFENLQVVHQNSHMEISLGRSIAIVSGLGGRGIRPQLHGGEWFASIYTSDQAATFGALFCNFVDATADCYMKDIAGRIPDVFTLSSSLPGAVNAAEQAERDAAEQAERDAAEQAERDAAEQAERDAAEQAERDAAEQAERDAAEQAERDAAETEAQEDDAPDSDNSESDNPPTGIADDDNSSIVDEGLPPPQDLPADDSSDQSGIVEDGTVGETSGGGSLHWLTLLLVAALSFRELSTRHFKTISASPKNLF